MKPRATGAWVVIALGCVLALVFLLSRTVSVEAVYPVEHAKSVWTQKVWTRIAGFFKGAEARAENVRLKRELASLALLQSDLERLETENARLRRTLGYTARNPGVWVPACVLSTEGGAAGAHQALRVDKGSLAGVRTGAIVMVPAGLVGKVTAVTPHTAEITLLPDPSLQVSCQVETGEVNPPTGVLAGHSKEDHLKLRYLKRAENIPPRARVITSGLGGVFPRGLEVGTYLAEGEVLPSVDYSSLEDVFIRREK